MASGNKTAVVIGFLSMSFIALVIGLTALVTDQWMTVCIDTNKFLDILMSNHDDVGISESTMKFLYKIYHDTGMCFNIGVFRATLGLGDTRLSLPMTEMDIYNTLCRGLLMLGLVILLIGFVFLCRNKNINSLKRYNELQIITMFIFIGGFLLTACMVLYTATNYEIVKNPEKFYSIFETEVVEVFTREPWSGAYNQTKVVLDESHPHFGYSYILGWVATAMVTASYHVGFVALALLHDRFVKSSIMYSSMINEQE